MSTSASEAGLSLAETMVAMALGLLALTLLVNFMVPSARFLAIKSTRAELEQMATMALNRVQSDLKRSVPEAVCVLPADPANPASPVAVGLNRVAAVNPAGRQEWEPVLTVIYWDKATGRLLRETCPPGPSLGLVPAADRMFQATPADLRAVIADPSGPQQVLANYVADFSCGQALPAYRLRLRLERRTVPNRPPESFEAVLSVAPRVTL